MRPLLVATSDRRDATINHKTREELCFRAVFIHSLAIACLYINTNQPPI